MSVSIRRQAMEVSMAGLLAAFAAVVIYGSLQLASGWGDTGPQAGYFPLRLGVLLLAVSLLLVVHAVRQPVDGQFADGTQLRRVFSLFGPNTALVINGSIFFMSECASNYILECLRIMLERRAHEMECLPEAYERYCAEVDAGNRQRAWGGVSLVNSWYRNKFGRASQAWPFPLAEFWERTRCPDTAAFRFG